MSGPSALLSRTARAAALIAPSQTRLAPALLTLAPLLMPLPLRAAPPPTPVSRPIAANAPIDVAVTNVKVAKGRVHVDICPEDKFLSSDCPYMAEAKAAVGTTIVTVQGVPPGRYAAQVFHDVNGNGKVDRGLFGIPTEPMGFSRDAPTPWRAPRWNDAVFVHGAEPQRITLALRKLP